jgi:DedD protein
MGLLSFFHRKSDTGSGASPTDADSVELARSRARRRLVGATVLVVLGVLGFPLLFDTVPRPLSGDIPIDIPRKDAAAPLVPKPASPPPAAVAAPKDDPVMTESAAEAGREVAASAAVPRVAIAPAAKPAEKPADKKPEPAASKPAAAKPAVAPDAARARAALEGKPAVVATKPEAADKATDGSVRFVVQVGAYSEADLAREARSRVEKLGYKTYTQVVETPSGKRIRVRIGPYADRGEADKVASKIKQSGLNSAVLTL